MATPATATSTKFTEACTEALEAIRRLSSLDNEIGDASAIIMSRMADIHQHADSALAISPPSARDFPAEFEDWWGTYHHRNRETADYAIKKQIAFDAFCHGARKPAAPTEILDDHHGLIARLQAVRHASDRPYAASVAEDATNAIISLLAALKANPMAAVTPASPDLIEQAFEVGFCWRSQLVGQTLEDSRAVGRTLQSYLFDDLDIDTKGFHSFESSDAGIVDAKSRIIAALRRKAIQAS